MNTVIEVKKAFISYCRTDREHALRVCDAIRALGWSPFIDEEEVPPGSGWRDILRRALLTSDLFVVVLTRRWASSPWAKLELDVYTEVCMKRPKPATPVIPLEFETVSGAEHMIPFLNETQVVKCASKLMDAELRWMLLCGAEAKAPGPRHLWAAKGLEVTKSVEYRTSLESEHQRLSSHQRLQLEDELSSRIKSELRIREIALRVFGSELDNLSSDSRSAWYQIVRQADNLNLIERLCEISKSG